MIKSNEDRIAQALETIAECMVKQHEMAKEALEKSQILYEANMAMMKENLKELPKPDPNLIQYDPTK